VIERVKSPKTRSGHEYHPLGRSKKVRTAVGRPICAAGARTLVAKGRKAGSTAWRARQSQKENPPGRCARPEAFLAFREASGWTTWRAPKGVGPGWQLEPSGHGFAIGGGRLRRRGGHLVRCVNEAPQPKRYLDRLAAEIGPFGFFETRNLSRQITRGSVLWERAASATGLASAAKPPGRRGDETIFRSCEEFPKQRAAITVP
jgi:hypothetical protein